MEKKELNLGLDIGTNSIGWALLDENNNLIKKNGFTFWGVRMFEEAKDASLRRTYRNSRRRLQRRKERINFLREIFKNEIEKIDFTFYERLDDSFYKMADKKYNNYYNIFVDGYNDKNFFTEFPTIYHLRNYIMNAKEKVDIRFIYLACHNIIKFRGNFLYQGDSFSKTNIDNLVNILNDFNSLIKDISVEFDEYNNNDYFGIIDKDFDLDFFKKMNDIINSKKSKREKQDELRFLFNVDKKSLVNEYFINLLTNSPVSFNKLSFVKDFNYNESKLETMSIDDLDGKLNEISDNCPDIYDLVMFTINVKQISDYYFLLKLLPDGISTISEAMIMQYNDHQKDLIRLKSFIKNYLPDNYYECFKDNKKEVNYAKYVGLTTVKGKLERFSHCKRADFYKYLKGLLEKVKDDSADADKKYFLSKIDNNELLLRQNSDQNGSIPMQLHLSELKQILNNQSKYYPFLNEISDGISNIDKIVSIFKFKIPYYVGPLNNKSNYSWVIKNNNEKIKPWNFDDVINKDKTAEKFIQRMQNKCTYLKGENDYCLPKKSLLYSEYECWSQLNKIKINGVLIDIELKKELFEQVFKGIARPTYTNVKKFFEDRGKTIDKFEFSCDMSSYVQLSKIFGNKFVEENKELIEKIIKDITIFEDKTILETRLRNYNISETKIKDIKKLNYKGYGRLSKHLLSELREIDNNTGEVLGPSIIEVMRETNYNLQEIINSDEYQFGKLIDEYNTEKTEHNNSLDEFIDENIQINPSMRRAMIQAINIINEIEKIFKRPIDYYYIECNRSNKELRGEKGRKKSRYERIKELYYSCKDIVKDYNINIEKLNNQLDSISKNGKFNDALQSESVFLYFTQLGKCMYTLEDIDFEELLNSQNMNYDIDHIYPQSLLKDDSFNNKVLVKKGKNNEKSDKFIFELHNFLDPNKNFKQFYEMLVDKELISKEKKNRLLKKEITDIELEGFVNRQLVSTSQSVKGLITILKLFKNVNPTHIIMSKAENISDFRHEYNLIKSRTANNYHHAHDAYLNVVVGKALNKYFSLHNLINAHDFIKLRQEESDENGKKEKIVLNVKKILNINRYFKGNIIWNKDLELGKPITFKTYETKSNKTYEEKVYNNGKIYHDLYERFDVNETTMTYNKNELLAKVTILPKNNGIVPIKSTTLRGNIAEYGGITSGSYSKFTLIKIVDKKNNEKIMLYPILTMNLNNIDNVIDKSKISKYEILVDNVKINDLIISGNTKAYISGAGDGGKALLLRNATDRNFDFRAIRLIRMLDSYFENKKNNRNVVVDYDNNKIIVSGSNRGYDRIMTFNEVDELYYSIVDIYSNKSFNYSQTKSIINSQELYSKLNIDEKLYFINQALFYLKTNERKTIDLKLIGGSTNSCMLKTTIGLKSGDKIIRKSYTGYYQTCLYEVK